MDTSYTVELSDVAEKVYVRIYEDAQACLKRGDEANSKVKQLRIVDDVLDRLIPHDPFAPERGLSGFLSGIYRIKKGRLRICYVGSSQTRKISVLYISDTPRKEGDSRDPYRILTRLVKSGKFDQILDRLGVKKPLKKSLRNLSHFYSHGLRRLSNRRSRLELRHQPRFSALPNGGPPTFNAIMALAI